MNKRSKAKSDKHSKFHIIQTELTVSMAT